jgi:hypothetical protein
MPTSSRIEILPIEPILRGHTLLSAAPQGDQTLIAEVGTHCREELVCHRYQTSQLRVLRGAVDLVILQNRRFRCISLREDEAAWLVIPPRVPHASINRGWLPAVLVNAVLLHGSKGDGVRGNGGSGNGGSGNDGSQNLSGHTSRIPPALLPQWHALVG